MAEALSKIEPETHARIKEIHQDSFGGKPVVGMVWNPRDNSLTILNSGGQVFCADSKTSDTKLLFDCCESDKKTISWANMAWNKEGTLLALSTNVCYEETQMFIWNSVEQHLKEMKRDVNLYELWWNTDGTLIASGDGRRICIWNPTKDNPVFTISCFLRLLEWKSENTFAVSSSANNIYVYQVGQSTAIQEYRGHQAEISAISFDEHGSFLMTGSVDGTVKMWSMRQKPVWSNCQAKREPIITVRWLYNTNMGPQVIASFSSSQINIWNFDGKRILIHEIEGSLIFASLPGNFFVASKAKMMYTLINQLRCHFDKYFKEDETRRYLYDRRRIQWNSQENLVACVTSKRVLIITLDPKATSAEVDGPKVISAKTEKSGADIVSSVAALQENCLKVTKDVEALKARKSKAEDIKEEISKLESSEFFLTLAQREEVETKLKKADAINSQVEKLKKDSSFLSNEEIENITLTIRQSEEGLKKLYNPFQTEQNLNDVLLKVQEDASRELECVICYLVPMHPAQVFSCVENHLLCDACKNNPSVLKCPVCRQDFERNPPTRNRLAEKMIQILK